MSEINKTSAQEPTSPAQELTPSSGGEVTFTQAEVDALISKEKARAVAKATKGMPKEDELTAFRAWKDSQQTEQERWDGLIKDRDAAQTELRAAQAELEQLKRLQYVMGKGYPLDEAEFIAFKASKLVNDDLSFEAAVDSLKKPEQTAVKVDLGGRMDGKAPALTVNEQINALIRGK